MSTATDAFLRLAEPDPLDIQRENLTRSLNEIANGIGCALREAGLNLPVLYHGENVRRLAGNNRHAARS